MPLRHPAERSPEGQRSPFDRVAQRVSHFASSGVFFALCLASGGVWVGGLVLGASDRFETLAAGAMTVITLLLVALLKNAELRAEHAIQVKLDAIAGALLDRSDRPSSDADGRLEDAIGVHEQI